MNICFLTLAPRGSRSGNRVTALRWARLVRQLGHRARIAETLDARPSDVLVALHAVKTSAAIEQAAARWPGSARVIALTGTDLYESQGSQERASARRSLELADRIILLQRKALEALPAELRPKARVIEQSALPPPVAASPGPGFPVCVIGHLRDVKDPFLAAQAARRLPARSQVRITQIGAALSDPMRARAEREMAENPRYRWLGEQRRSALHRLLAQSRILALTSRSEGGANVVSEAIAAGVPVVSTRIPGTIGLLGDDYPGYFPVGDAQALATLLLRAEEDPAFYRTLQSACDRVRPLLDPARERDAWARLLAELAGKGRGA